MAEKWIRRGAAWQNQPFEIEEGVPVWDHTWYSEGGEKVRVLEEGRFLDLAPYVIVAGTRHIVFAATDLADGYWTFWLRV